MPNNNSESQRKAGFFHALGKFFSEELQVPGNELYKSAHNVSSKEVWMDSVPFATVGAADAIVAANPTIVKKIGSSGAAFMYPLSNTNYQTWFLDEGDPTWVSGGFVPSTQWVKSLISPTDITDANGLPSNGYIFQMFLRDGVSSIPYTSAGYDVDYFSGLIRFDVGRTPKDSSNGYGQTINVSNTGLNQGTNADKLAYIRNASTSGPRAIAYQYIGQRLSNYDFSGGATGATGATGSSAYEAWVYNGGVGTQTDFLTSLKGATGASGSIGSSGTNGTSGTSGISGADGTDGDKYRYQATYNLNLLSFPTTLTIGLGLAYSPAQSIIIAFNGTDYVEATVTTYNSGTGEIVYTIDTTNGTATSTNYTRFTRTK